MTDRRMNRMSAGKDNATVLIKLVKPLPELFGFRKDVPFCVIGQETDEGDTVQSLLQKLGESHPDFREMAFTPVPGMEDASPIVWHLNGRFAPPAHAVRNGDMLTVFVGGG